MPAFLGDPKIQYFQTGTGEFLTGGKVYTYASGTTTPMATYSTIADALAQTNPNSNPIILDSRGEAVVVVNGSTKIVLHDANDVLIWTVDDIGATSEDILDANGNTLLHFVTSVNAVNEWTISNAGTGSKPSFKATGSDTNVGGAITTQGSGNLLLDGGSTGNVLINSVSSGTTTLGTATTITGALTCSSTLAVTGNATVTGSFQTQLNIATTATTNFLPAGTVIWKASLNVPQGWLECDGSAISRTTYATLFADIGTAFGVGDGSTTFNLPLSARKVLMGRGGTGTSTIANTIAATGGEETHALITAEMPAHTHNYLFPGSVLVTTGTGSTVNASTGNATATTSVGSGTAHNNIQPSLVMMMIIRAY